MHNIQNKTHVEVEEYIPKWVDVERLGDTMLDSINDFGVYGDVTDTKDGLMVFKDNDAKILAVGHLDSVVKKREWSYDSHKATFYSPQLDDRLGVHIILNELAQRTGLKFDILLTDSEEIGRSTAQHFVPKKDYNWVFEIDRFGTNDAALYQYKDTNPAWETALKQQKFSVVCGSNTDIAYLDFLKVCAVNWSCAYYNNHSESAHADLKALDEQMERIVKFISINQHKKFVYVPKPKKDYSNYYNNNVTYPPARTVRTQNTTNKQRWTPAPQQNYINIGESIDVDCYICKAQACSGVKACGCCGFEHHADMFVETFGMCSSCIYTYYDVSQSVLSNFRYGKVAVEKAEIGETILKELGCVWLV